MNEAIKVNQAEIHTATVDVGILRITGKQVTLAVFRQLREEQVVGDEGQFVGLPWGTVNYHPAKECGGADGRHFHVVWQKGNELRRATVNRPKFPRSPAYSEAAQDYVIALSSTGWRPKTLPRPVRLDGSYYYEMRVETPEGVVELDVPFALFEFWRYDALAGDGRERYQWDQRGDVPQHPEPQASLDELQIDVLGDVRAHFAALDQEDLRWQEIQALPQLFIAV